MELTQEQRAIVAEARSGASFKVPAFAGTGKTATLVAVADAIAPRPTLYLAFNTAMAREARTRFAGRRHVSVLTAHALAFRQVGHVFAQRLEPRAWAISRAIAARFTGELSRLAETTDGGAQIALGTIQKFEASGAARILPEHVVEDHRARVAAETIAEAAERIWRAMVEPDSDLPVSHDTYFKAWQVAGADLGAWQTIFFDEAQDASGAMLAVLESARGHQRIFVGDAHQQLYRFRGAVNAMQSIALPAFPLTQSWRFGSAIAKVANFILEAKGERLEVKGAPARHDVVVRRSGRPPTAVVARTNAGLFDEALEAIGREAAPRIGVVGGAEELLRMVLGAHELRHTGRSSHPAFRFFRSWAQLEETTKGPQGSEYGPFVQIVKRYGSALPELCGRVRQACVDVKEADLVLSTVHKFKGKESAHVRLAGDFRPFCYRDRRTGKPCIDEDEANVQYVAVTRAEQILELGSYADALVSALECRAKMPPLAKGG